MTISRFRLLLASTFLIPTFATAQEGPVQLGTIYLNADKRGEALNEQPRSVTVLEGQGLDTTPTEPGAGIALNSPGLHFSGFGQPGTDFLNIRGVGPLGYPLSATDHTVAHSVDEVPTSTFGFPPALFDMDQVEVVRGPQGTLFGRNALAGGINFVPRGADGVEERKLTVEAGTDGHLMTEVIAGGWILNDRLAGRVALRFQDFDGDVPNTIANGTEGGASLAAVRLSLTGYTDSGWTISTMLQADRRESHNSYLLYLEHPNFPESGDDRIPRHTRDNRQVTLRIENDFGPIEFTSLTGYQVQDLTGDVGSTDAYLFAALTGLPPGTFVNPNTDYFLTAETEKLFSQELRFSSTGAGAFSWVAGANYLQSDYDGRRVAESGSQPTGNGVTDVAIDTRSWSIFADGTYAITERLRLSGGIRHGSEKQSVDGLYVSNGFPGTVPTYSQTGSIKDTYTTGRLGLSFDFNQSITGYVSYSRGYAAGGYEKLLVGAATGVETVPFKAASNDSWEVGLKFQDPSDRLRFNVALFHNDVNNGQMFDYAFEGGAIVYTFTNQDYRSRGLEVDGAFQVTDALRLRGSLTLLDSEMYNVLPTSNTGAANGNKVPLTPSLSTTLGFEYEFPIAGHPAQISLDWSHVGKRQGDIGNQFTLPSYDIVNARLSWQRGQTSFYVFANNLLDERPVHYSSQYTPTVHTASVGTGRVIGLGLSTEF